MKSFFNMDHPLFRGISRIGDMFLMSFMWLITSIPIITLGASTTALIDTAIKIVRRRDTNVIKDYFKSFKDNFKASTIIFLIFAVIGVLLYLDIDYWGKVGGTYALILGGLSVGIFLMYAATLLFVFAVQAIFINNIKSTIRTAFFMSLKHWVTSLMLIALIAAVSFVCWTFPIAAFFMFMFGVGAFALIFAVQYITVFSKHNPELMQEKIMLSEGIEEK